MTITPQFLCCSLLDLNRTHNIRKPCCETCTHEGKIEPYINFSTSKCDTLAKNTTTEVFIDKII
jgi:hypothetical protein